MPAVGFDDKAFTVGAGKVWVVSGAVHYFRVPRELWRDRLLKLKRAGCNTVETYTAWNLHEPAEGQFDFAGMADLDAFLSLAEELNLWVIVRPGPYICSEWDNGGLPAWLIVKPGVKLRVANPVYHKHIRLYFEKLIPIVERHQATRGGRVLLVQDENEFIFRNRPGGREHLVFIRDLLRELGIDVPIIVCNFLAERIPGTVECWNCWNAPDQAVRNLRNVQSDAPALVTEFWVGWFDAWAHKSHVDRKSPREVHAASLRILAAGGMYSYYMFHGGSNFGVYPGRTQGDDHTYMTSSYDYGAPLAETGALPEKYYAAKLASVTASNLESFFAESEPARLAVSSADDVDIVTRRADEGHLIFVFNRSRKKTASLQLPGGLSLSVSFKDLDALVLPYNYRPSPGFTIEYSNLSLMGKMAMGVGRLVFLYGPRGCNAVLSAQGRAFRRKVSANAQVWFGNFPNLVAVMDTDRARRTWFLPDRTVVGADFVGEVAGDKVRVGCRSREQSVVTYFPNGRVTYAVCSRTSDPPKLPALSRWKKLPLLPAARPSKAVRVDVAGGDFAPLESLGYTGGYGLYHTVLKSPAARTETLLFSDAEDRLTVFSNSKRAGTFGRGPGASTGLVTVALKKGANNLQLLLDNLGRANYTISLGETKGLRGPVYLAARQCAATMKWTPGRYNGTLAKTWQIETFWPKVKAVVATLSVVFAVDGEGAVLRLQNVDEPAAIFVNRKFHSYFWGSESLHRLDLRLPVALFNSGKNLIEIAFFVKPDRKVSRNVSVYAFREENVLADPWHFAPLDASNARPSARRIPPGAPVAWKTSFNLKDPAVPVRLVTEGLEKGEVYLNGRLVGRHWKAGPQKQTYLPEPWLTGANTLILVDELGVRPTKVRLEYDERANMHYDTV